MLLTLVLRPAPHDLSQSYDILKSILRPAPRNLSQSYDIHLGLSSRPIQKSYQGHPVAPWADSMAPTKKVTDPRALHG
jgi:hypothetical protein